jgi:hypothetical protein
MQMAKKGFFEREAWFNLAWPIAILIIAILAALMIPLLMKLK